MNAKRQKEAEPKNLSLQCTGQSTHCSGAVAVDVNNSMRHGEPRCDKAYFCGDEHAILMALVGENLGCQRCVRRGHETAKERLIGRGVGSLATNRECSMANTRAIAPNQISRDISIFDSDRLLVERRHRIGRAYQLQKNLGCEEDPHVANKQTIWCPHHAGFKIRRCISAEGASPSELPTCIC
ncbi:MAG: hypothetical protein AAGJ40_24620 [Planctomycetota bacterium]